MIKIIVDNQHFKWIDIVYPTREELHEMAELYAIHLTSIQDCLQPEHLPKYEKIGDVTFLITRAYDDDSAVTANTVLDLTRKVAIFLGAHVLLTVHRIDQAYLVKVRDKWSNCQETTENIHFEILNDLLEAILESYEKPLNLAENMLDQFENQVFLHSSTLPFSFQELYLLRRKVSVYQRMIHLSTEILLKLEKLESISPKNAPFLQNLREYADRLHFVTEQLAENINHLLTLHLSLQSHRTNETMRILTLFSVFFMPLTFIVGIYGMNFEFMPELKFHYGYPVVLILMLMVTFALLAWFRRKGFFK